MNQALRSLRVSLALSILLAFTTSAAVAQIAAQPAPDPSRSQSASAAVPANIPPLPSAADIAADTSAFNGLLGELNSWAQKTNADLGKIKTDKWKTDSPVKQQGQSNVESLQRNLTAALPQFISQLQGAPQQLGPNLKLYRNLNVVYDVLVSVAESAGAFGPKEIYGPLADDTGRLELLRRQVADRLDWLAGVRDNEVGTLRQQLQVARAAAAAAVPPKKVSDEEAAAPAKKRSRKATKKTATNPTPQTPQ